MTEDEYVEFLHDGHEHAKTTLTNLLSELAPATVVDFVRDFVDAEGPTEDQIGISSI
jgi:hypothetical protein